MKKIKKLITILMVISLMLGSLESFTATAANTSAKDSRNFLFYFGNSSDEALSIVKGEYYYSRYTGDIINGELTSADGYYVRVYGVPKDGQINFKGLVLKDSSNNFYYLSNNLETFVTYNVTDLMSSYGYNDTNSDSSTLCYISMTVDKQYNGHIAVGLKDGNDSSDMFSTSKVVYDLIYPDGTAISKKTIYNYGGGKIYIDEPLGSIVTIKRVQATKLTTGVTHYAQDLNWSIKLLNNGGNSYSYIPYSMFTVPTNTPTPTEKPTSTPTPTEKPTSTPTPTEEPTNTPAPTEEPTNTPAPTEGPTNTPAPTEEPTNTPAPTEGPTNTPIPTVEPTNTPIPTVEPTNTLTPTDEPIATEEPTVTVKPTATEEPTVVARPTATVEPTTTPIITEKLELDNTTLSSGVKSVKLISVSAKNSYKVYANKKVKLEFKTNGKNLQYQIVKKGKKLGNSWKKLKSRVVLNTSGIVYIKYTLNGDTIVKKTNGIIVDTKKPIVKIVGKKLKVTDKESGIKSIKVNGKIVKNNSKLKNGRNKIVVVDKAGNIAKKIVKIK